MTEIRDRVKGEALEFIRHGASPEQILEKILSIPELAIVDRKAELPSPGIEADLKHRLVTLEGIIGAYRMAQQDMGEAGWVKEVK